MNVILNCCAGFDVHKSLLVVNLVRTGVSGKKDIKMTVKYTTMTRHLLELSDWLQKEGCTHIAMESTGVYWKPIYNLFEDKFEIILVNARDIKNVPGRKTDIKDSEWIAQLLQHGLLKKSFIPPKPIRDLRDLTRQRRKLIQQKASIINRIQKILEDANIKLASVISNVNGKSGRGLLQAIIQKKSLSKEEILALSYNKVKLKIEKLELALEGKVTEHHAFMLNSYFTQIDFMDKEISNFCERIEEMMKPYFDQIPALEDIPGIQKKNKEDIIAEIGIEMNQFPSAAHISSWAGMCPGNNESAGKRKSSKTTKGCKWLRAALSEAAWAVSKTMDTYLKSKYQRIASRRGKKRAIIAMGHHILRIIYYMIKYNASYEDLGADFLEKQNKERLIKYYTKKLESLGCKMELIEGEEKIAG